MRILVAGGAGFIGSHAVTHFSNCGDDVYVLDALTYAGDVNRIKESIDLGTKFFKLDIRDRHAVERCLSDIRPEYLVNFAAETHVDRSIVDAKDFITTNFEGACNLMNLCREYSTFYVHMSTDEVYGAALPYASRGFIESDKLDPKNPYAASKAAADHMLEANRNTYGQPYLAFRPSNNYGPRQNEEKFLPKLIKCLIAKPGTLNFPLYGIGDQIREWTYVKDTARAIRASIVEQKRGLRQGGFVNVSSNVSMTNVDLISHVKHTLSEMGCLNNPDCITSVQDRKGHDRCYWIESSVKCQFTPFDVALRETIASFALAE